MSSLFPPILEAQRTSIPSYVPPAARTDFVIPISLPLSTNPAAVRAGHIQVLIRRQVDMQPWSDITSINVPERDVIYLPGSQLSADNLSIVVPYGTMKALIAGSAPGASVIDQTGRTYTIQVRFGETPLWLNLAQPFATWKATQVANSLFGEWSNTQRIFVYGVPTSGSILTVSIVDDVIGKIKWQYTPISQDPIVQVRVSYSWSTPDSFGNTFRSRNVEFNNSNGQNSGSFGEIELEAMRFAQITIGIRFITINNTVLDWTYVIPPYTFVIDPNAGNRIQQYPIVGEEIEDGVLALTFTGAFRRRTAISTTESLYYNIYRVDVVTLETILLTSFEDVVGSTFSHTIRDYSVEMGAEYVYIAVSYGKSTGKVHYTLVPITGLLPSAWNPVLYSGYGRQMDFQGNIFLTTKWQQLRLQGNLNISSFQRNTSDQFTPTIGGEHPYYSRSAKFNYRTFGLQGLVSIHSDSTHTFLKFKAQQSPEVVKAKTRIAEEYQTAVEALNRTQGDYQQRVQELQVIYYSRLKMIYQGINPPPVPSGDPALLPIDWMTGQLWFVENQDVDSIQIRTPDLFSMEEHSENRKRVKSRTEPDNEWIDSLDSLDGRSPSYPNNDWRNRTERVRGATTVFDDQLRQDTTEVRESSRKSHLIYAERKFRDAVMQWLSDGRPKLIRSETEGNMIVMLSNVSFTPLTKSREVYSLSATVTEIATFNLSNLIRYGLAPVDFEPFYIPGIEFGFIPGSIDNNVTTAY